MAALSAGAIIAGGAIAGSAIAANQASKASGSAPRLPDISGGGLQVFTSKDPFDISVLPTTDPAGQLRQETVLGLQNVFRRSGDFFGRLRETGEFGRAAGGVQQALLDPIQAARQRTVGTISENLARRRVLGSSFGQAAIAQAEREFAQAESRTFLEALDAEIQLAGLEFNSQIDVFNAQMAELDKQLQAGLSIAGASIPAAVQNFGLQQQLRAEAAGGLGAGIGELAGLALGAFGGGGAV